MAPEESAEAAGLLQSFERRYLAARTLRSFPWQVGGGTGDGGGGAMGEGAPGARPLPPAAWCSRLPRVLGAARPEGEGVAGWR